MNSEWIKDFVVVLLIFLRISSALISSPVFGNKAFPILNKIFLSILIAYILFLTIQFKGFETIPTGWMIFVYSIKEILTGLTIGFMMQIVFWGVSFAGTLIGFDMGLNLAEVFNPMEESNNNVIGEFLFYGAILIFFLINGHHYIISGLKYSFSVVPIGKFTFTKALIDLVIQYTEMMFVIAVKIASPIMVSFFLIHIAEGILTKLIPQIQIFFVTQPLKIGIGLFLLAFITPIYIYVIKNLLQDYEGKLMSLIQAMGT